MLYEGILFTIKGSRMGNTVLRMAIIMLIAHYSAINAMKCNGDKLLCDMSYNYCFQVVSHNATSYEWSLVQDQEEDIKQQLKRGARVFKIPLHFDYENRLGYYDSLIRSYLKEIGHEIEALEKEIGHRKKSTFITLEDKKREVHKLQNLIDETQQEIDVLKNWFDNLPTFSFKGDSKTLRALDYAARVGALEVKKGFLIASKETALFALETAQKAGDVIVSRDPRLDILKGRKKLLEASLQITSDHKERAVFACHALPKAELYSDFIGNMIRSAPEILKPILEVLLSPLRNLSQAALRELYGSPEAAGGSFPYPACLLDASAMPLKRFLSIIKEFLDEHPHEVVTVLLNDFINNDAAIAQTCEATGILSYAYGHDQAAPWPTLRQLIEQGKRLIVMSDRYGPDVIPSYPWLNNQRFYTDPWPTHYAFSSPEIFEDSRVPLAKFGDFSYRDTSPFNKILYIHYTVTSGMAGDAKNAARINSFAVSKPHFERIMQAAERPPTWVSVDFINLPPQNGIFEAVKAINNEWQQQVSAQGVVSQAEAEKATEGSVNAFAQETTDDLKKMASQQATGQDAALARQEIAQRLRR